jgi:hypothetical protein
LAIPAATVGCTTESADGAITGGATTTGAG